MAAERLNSERVVIQSPMSFTGSARRIWRWTWTDNIWVKWLLAIPAALATIALVWTIVACWYLLFGLFVAPWRLLRRGSRKRKRDEMRHREAMRQYP